MKSERIDGLHLDESTAQELADLTNAVSAVDAPHIEPISAEHLRLGLTYGWDGDGRPDVLAARTDGGELAAFAEIMLPRWDNQHMMFAELNVHPDHRGAGADDAVIEDVFALMKERDRTQFLANAWAGTELEQTWLAHGLEIGSREAQRRLLPPRLEWERLDELHAASVEASTAYEIVNVPQPVPDDLVEGMLELQRTMNDAPLDDLALDDFVWTEERYRKHEQALTDRRMRNHYLAARERDTGAWAGFTAVVVEDERPHLGFQEDTAVVRGHRGHRLGLRLKIEMLRLLRDEEPQVVQIDTWNAESNSHMIGVNDAIGCFVVARGVEFQRDLSAPAADA